MKILEILWQNRRDFKAKFICEHCNSTTTAMGYDDDNFHQNVIPKLECKDCKKVAPEDYRPMGTVYPEGQQV